MRQNRCKPKNASKAWILLLPNIFNGLDSSSPEGTKIRIIRKFDYYNFIRYSEQNKSHSQNSQHHLFKYLVIIFIGLASASASLSEDNKTWNQHKYVLDKPENYANCKIHALREGGDKKRALEFTFIREFTWKANSKNFLEVQIIWLALIVHLDDNVTPRLFLPSWPWLNFNLLSLSARSFEGP